MKKIVLMMVTVLMALSSCIKEPIYRDPSGCLEVHNERRTVTDTSAIIQCDSEISRYHLYSEFRDGDVCTFFVFGESENDMQDIRMDTVEIDENDVLYTIYTRLRVTLSGLRPNTLYYYYYVCRNGFDSSWTETKSFKTGPVLETELPTVITGDITEITDCYAHVQWFVTDDGGYEVTESGVCWGVNENPSLDDNTDPWGSQVGFGEYHHLIWVNPNTTYHVRAYATNAVGTAYGEDKTFTTLSADGSNAPIGAIDDLFTINANGMDGRAIQDN